MNPTQPSSPSRHGGALSGRLNMATWRKHYVATMTADEEAWPQREPGSNLGRVFIILLLLHVFLIGAVVLYNIICPKSPPIAKMDPKAVVVKKPETPAVAKTSTPPRGSSAGPASTAAMASPAKTEVKPIDTGIYEVRSGDNVPGIASALGVTAEDLIKLNNLDTTELYPGRKLTYPKKPPAAVAETPKSQPAKTSSSPATVVTTAPKPENLKTIESSPPKPKVTAASSPAKPDALPKAILIQAPSPAAMSVADQPPAPSSKTSPKEFTVESSPPAPPAKGKADKPARGKSDNTPKTAAKSDKPSSKTEKTSKSKGEKSAKEVASRKSHVVAPNETLYSIARKYGVKVAALQKVNNIKDPTTLHEGAKLVIPSKS